MGERLWRLLRDRESRANSRCTKDHRRDPSHFHRHFLLDVRRFCRNLPAHRRHAGGRLSIVPGQASAIFTNLLVFRRLLRKPAHIEQKVLESRSSGFFSESVRRGQALCAHFRGVPSPLIASSPIVPRGSVLRFRHLANDAGISPRSWSARGSPAAQEGSTTPERTSPPGSPARHDERPLPFRRHERNSDPSSPFSGECWRAATVEPPRATTAEPPPRTDCQMAQRASTGRVPSDARW